MFGYSDPVAVSDQELRRFTQFALGVAESAGDVILPFFRADVAIHDKGEGRRFDPVTEADRAAEAVIRREIEIAFPAHGVFGEEFGATSGNGLTWVIDPIDGTRAFMTGMLHWGLLLALFDGQTPVLGVMHQPFTGETFYGDNRSARYRRAGQERVLRTRQGVALDAAVLTTTSPRLFADGDERAAFDRLERAVKLSKYGGDCYIYAMVAMGYVDLASDAGLKPYDIQALMPIIRGAGGTVTTMQGGDPSMGGCILASGSAELHRQALECAGRGD